MKAALSPGATGHTGGHVIDRSGHVAQTVALQLQRLTDHETSPLVLGDLVCRWTTNGSRPSVGTGIRCRCSAGTERRRIGCDGDLSAA